MSIRLSVSTAAPTVGLVVNAATPRVNMSVGAGGGNGGTLDHRQLIHRDAAEQHPIEAISGLEEALAARVPTASEAVLGGIMVGANLKIDENGVLSVDPATLIDYIDTVILGGAS